MEPSSSNTGFFQQQPVIKNQWYDDISLQRVAKLFLPPTLVDKVSPEISKLGDEVLTQQIFDWVTDAEHNQPYIRGHGRDSFGKPKSELIVTEGWRKLQEFGLSKGFVAINYDTTEYGPYTRLVQFLRCHLWEGSCANTLCPAAMQDGAARLLQRHLANPKAKSKLSPLELSVFQNAYNHLTSRDPSYAWTSGQWMTERTGGSDVSQTETVATYSPFPSSSPNPLASLEENTPQGPYSISGFKWFSSATDSSMTILLAKTSPSKPVSAFFAPMRRHNPALVSHTGEQGGGTELNGVTIQRLKHKFGTQSLPTAELELKGLRGWMIGEEGKGIQEISTILNITRVHTTVSSVGYLGRALGIAKAFALVREVGVGKGRRISLGRHPLHMRTLSSIAGDYHGMMLLTFFTLRVLGQDERGEDNQDGGLKATVAVVPTPPKEVVPYLLRILSSLHKSYVCENTIPLVYQCMESLGGVGYMQNVESEHLNVSRLFRDACVGAIWEGTTDVLASDTVRALKHPLQGEKCVKAVEWFVHSGLETIKRAEVRGKVKSEWEVLKAKIESRMQDELLPEARDVTFRLAEILIAVLFLLDVAAYPGTEIEAMCDRFLRKKGFAVGDTAEAGGVKGGLELDQAIVYGPGKGPNQHDASKTDSKL
ncbi:acyl-CoA dehydrogenase/oxidase [Cladorrhinum sp. PSN259]|nr:acyl-CoA dehydrogenase/oxidase [Cladorrhinum sp. PSN259]